MSEVVETVNHPDGSRTLIYDNGSRELVLAEIEIEGDTGVSQESRGLAATPMFMPPAAGPHRGSGIVEPSAPGMLDWLRGQIAAGNTYRESTPILSAPPDTYVIVEIRDGWAYQAGLNTGTLLATQAGGEFSGLQFLGSERYLWALRGSDTARALWRRDFRRTQRAPASLLVSEDVQNRLADSGLPPEAAVPRSTATLSASDIPEALMLIPRAALHAQEDFSRYTDRFVRRYDQESYGPFVGTAMGIVEFGFQLITSVIGLPASLEELYRETRRALAAFRDSLPLIVTAMENAPAETTLIILNTMLEALGSMTGVSEIGEDIGAGVEHAEEGRSAQSSLNIIRATGRVINLLLLIKGLVAALRRLPAVAARMRGQLSRLNSLVRRLRRAAPEPPPAAQPRSPLGRARPRRARVNDGPGGRRRARELRRRDRLGRRRARRRPTRRVRRGRGAALTEPDARPTAADRGLAPALAEVAPAAGESVTGGSGSGGGAPRPPREPSGRRRRRRRRREGSIRGTRRMSPGEERISDAFARQGRDVFNIPEAAEDWQDLTRTRPGHTRGRQGQRGELRGGEPGRDGASMTRRERDRYRRAIRDARRRDRLPQDSTTNPDHLIDGRIWDSKVLDRGSFSPQSVDSNIFSSVTRGQARRFAIDVQNVIENGAQVGARTLIRRYREWIRQHRTAAELRHGPFGAGVHEVVFVQNGRIFVVYRR
ncbi:MAG: hypothetical protein AAFX56_04060 [Pseudomonadota bacterium]